MLCDLIKNILLVFGTSGSTERSSISTQEISLDHDIFEISLSASSVRNDTDKVPVQVGTNKKAGPKSWHPALKKTKTT